MLVTGHELEAAVQQLSSLIELVEVHMAEGLVVEEVDPWDILQAATWTCSATRSSSSAAAAPAGWTQLHRAEDPPRLFTSFKLMTILEENHHSFLIVERDPMLYEDAG